MPSDLAGRPPAGEEGQALPLARDELRLSGWSPSWQAHRCAGPPLLIHTTTNDEDVNVPEVERLIQALKAEGKEFEYKIYQDAPGGHIFNRIDTPLARESRREIYRFLAQCLHPAREG